MDAMTFDKEEKLQIRIELPSAAGGALSDQLFQSWPAHFQTIVTHLAIFKAWIKTLIKHDHAATSHTTPCYSHHPLLDLYSNRLHTP